MRVHEVVAATLRGLGVETLFGLMGNSNMLSIADFVDRGGAYHGAVQEGGAVSMADGYSRFAGRVGVATVTYGPGLTNTLTAVVEAARSRSPLLVVTGRTPTAPHNSQEFDVRGFARLAESSYVTASGPGDVASSVARAYRLAWQGRTPVILDVPGDYLLLEAAPPRLPATLVAGPSSLVGELDLDSEAVDGALGLLANARRPLVVAGRGAVLSGAREQVVALADRLGAALATTVMAKDYFRGHDFDLGVLGGVGHGVAIETAMSADVVVAVGAALTNLTTMDGTLLRGKRVVQIDLDPGAIGRYSDPDVALVGDAARICELLLASLPEDGDRAGLRTPELARSLAELDLRAQFGVPPDAPFADMRVSVAALEPILPARRAVVTDGGRFLAAPWRFLSSPWPGGFTHALTFGAIGLGLATAVGAAAALRDHTVIAVVGDGGGMAGMLEFETAVRERIPLIVVVLDDHAYGMEYRKLSGFGADPRHALIPWPSFADLAIAMGGRGVTLASEDDLAHVEQAIAEGTFPLLIDVKADPTIDVGTLS
jgi:thiamine pyrophosphate-dependent acetolactate synthase large subunit-like protein